MATVYANPVAKPEFLNQDGSFNYKEYEIRCEQYRQDTEEYLRTVFGAKNKYVGKIIRFPVADGYAQYMLWTATNWIYLEEVDGNQVSEATTRGYRAQDVDEILARQERFAALFRYPV